MTAADLYRLRVRCAASRDIPSADVIALLDQYALLDAAAERDELAAKVARVRELHRQTTYVSVLVMGGPNVTDYACAHCGPTYGWPCPTRRAIDGPQSDALTFELPKPPTGHMVGGLITEGHAGQRLHADKGAES